VFDFTSPPAVPFALEVGRVVHFEYPAHNRVDLPLEWVFRRVRIVSYRFLAAEPLEAESILRRPGVRRGSVLIVGYDLDIGAERKFYLEAIRGYTLPRFRLGLISPESPECGVSLFGPLFEANPAGVAKFTDAISRCLANPADEDLRLVAAPAAA